MHTASPQWSPRRSGTVLSFEKADTASQKTGRSQHYLTKGTAKKRIDNFIPPSERSKMKQLTYSRMMVMGCFTAGLIKLFMSPALALAATNGLSTHFFIHTLACIAQICLPFIYRSARMSFTSLCIVSCILIYLVPLIDVYYLQHSSAALLSFHTLIPLVSLFLVGLPFGVLYTSLVLVSSFVVAYAFEDKDFSSKYSPDELALFETISLLSTTIVMSLVVHYFKWTITPSNAKMLTFFHPPRQIDLLSRTVSNNTALSVISSYDPIEMLIAERGEDWIYEETEDAYVAFLGESHALQYARLLGTEGDEVYLAWLEQEGTSPLYRLEGTTSLESIHKILCLVHMRPYKDDLYILLRG